ncbi:MAG: hypothetical protein KBG15_08280 [Kofleriaceae bacterium]|nr:hypothetical protein [Kofleriaceae bacterium]
MVQSPATKDSVAVTASSAAATGIVEGKVAAAPMRTAEGLHGSRTHRFKVAALSLGAIFAVYMLLTGREPPWGDARIMYEVSENITQGRISVGTEWPPMSHVGADGRIYSQYALLPSLLHLPGAALGSAFRGAGIHRVVTSHLAPAFAAALTVVLFLLTAQTFCSRRASRAAAAVLALGSLLFVYARYPMSEALQAATVMGMLGAALRSRSTPTFAVGIGFGAWCGAVVNTKSVLLLSVLGLGAVVLWLLRRNQQPMRRWCVGVLVGGLPFLVLFGWYNTARWGAPWSTGYGETLGMMSEHPWAGLLGLLVSPGKGLLWFSPAVIVAVLGLRRMVQTHGDVVRMIVAIVIPPLLFYSGFLSWSGDYAWGPRYLVFAMAPLYLGVAYFFDSQPTRLARWLVRGIIAVSVVVQLLGAAVFWDHWIRIARKANIEWLGQPNRTGAAIAEKGRGHCDSCFEDMHAHQWLPPFSPLLGQRWLVQSLLTNASWAQAEADAPWRRYTKNRLQTPKAEFDQIRVDWWPLAVRPGSVWQARVLGWLGLWLVLGGLCSWRLWRLRRAAPAVS